jgi:hypothetical protein
LDLTFALHLCGSLGCEFQIHSTGAAFLFEVSGSNSPLVLQELQIGGTRAVEFCSIADVSGEGNASTRPSRR